MFSASIQMYSKKGDWEMEGRGETESESGDAGSGGRGDGEICWAITWPGGRVERMKTTIRIALEIMDRSTRENWWLLRLRFFSETCSS